MKVCMVLAGQGAGGLEKHFVELANEVAKHATVIAIAHDSYGPRLHRSVIFEPLDLAKDRRNIRVLYQLAKIIKFHQPDVVHAQANKAAYMVSLIRHFLRARTIATLHNQGKQLAVYAGFDAVISVNKEELARVPNGNKFLILNGIEPSLSRADRSREPLISEFPMLASHPRVFAAIGRFVPAKGFDFLLDVWANVRAPLLLVGDGPQKPALRRQVEKLGLADRVTFTGFRNDVPSLLSSVDCLVISSRREGFPYLLVESLHLGTPVISTKVSGCKETLPERYLCDVGDEPSLLQIILYVCQQNAAVVSEEFRPVFEYARSQLTSAEMARKTMEVYAGVGHG